MEQPKRILPVGIQSFEKIRQEGFLYVDKTDLVWKLTHNDYQYNYLSRPRRFGKSVLVDTLQCYFEGRKELFAGLKIMDLEEEWVKRPVIRLDLSRGGANAQTLRSYLNISFKQYEEKYEIVPEPTAELADRLDCIITTAYQKTGHRVAILIDEYDSPLQHSWKTPDHDECAEVYREVFNILKADDAYEKFVFITGITKFTQISLFSVLNNLCNISFSPCFAAICGITEDEIDSNFEQEVTKMAEVNGWSFEETHKRLKDYYDGYHFDRQCSADVYNPFSLINALSDSYITNYWVSSGATTLLPKFIDDMEVSMGHFEHCGISRVTLESSDITSDIPELFLYQAGYLTIKEHNEFGYILGFPNDEVKQALYDMVLPALTLRKQGSMASIQYDLSYQLGMGELDKAKQTLKSLIADVPYSNKKLASMDMEERYRLIVSTILNSIGMRVEVEHMLATGRIDIVAWTTRYIYVIELKLQNNGGMKTAAKQIRDNGYMEPFKADRRKVVGLAIELDDLGKGLVDWEVI